MSKELAANTTLSHYRIVSKLGAGGMGEVYLAQDTSELGRTVALKILPSELARDKDRLQRFIQEARTVSNLNHPNILTVHEFGQTESASFMATEYVDGVTLRQHLSNRRFKLVDVLDVAIQMVAALNAAHDAGVTHRDLKPENVMVRRDHIVKVLDFGLAKPSLPSSNDQIDSKAGTKVLVHTEPGLVMGTVSYMSPEQSVGKGVDQRTDIWSAGVVLYEMIAGCVPFTGKDIHRQIIAIQEAEPVPLSQQVEGLPERLEEIVFKCLAKENDERYQTAKDLLIDLRNLRRKLDVDAEIERTVAPQLRASSGSASREGTQGARTDAGDTSAAQVRPTSSAEFIIGEVKNHKLGVAVASLILLALIAVGSWFFFNRTAGNEQIDSIAVLPFANSTGDKEIDFLSEGIAETLINNFTKIPELQVTARSTAFRFRGREGEPQEVGRELGVGSVLTGKLLQRGDTLSIQVDLIKTSNGVQIWGNRYEGKSADIVNIQQRIATDVSSQLKLKLTGAQQQQVAKTYTQNSEAYQRYLRGRYYWNKRTADDLKKGLLEFQAAADIDPGYALAYVGLADCYVLLEEYAGVPSSESLPKAQAFAQKALQIDDSIGEAHATLGLINNYMWRWAEAETELKRAIELNPNYPTAHHWYNALLRDTGRFVEATAEIKRGQQLDPLSGIIGVNVGFIYLATGDPTSAVPEFKRIIEFDPNWWAGHFFLGTTYLKLGRNEEALTELQKSVELTNGSGRSIAFLGYAYGVMGKRSEAQAILKELEDKYTKREAIGQNVAAVYMGLGDKEQAFAWLEKDLQARSGELVRIKWYPPFDSLRDDLRFKDLIRRMGLAE